MGFLHLAFSCSCAAVLLDCPSFCPLSLFLPQCLCTCYSVYLEGSSTNLHMAASLSSFPLHLIHHLFREDWTDPTGRRSPYPLWLFFSTLPQWICSIARISTWNWIVAYLFICFQLRFPLDYKLHESRNLSFVHWCVSIYREQFLTYRMYSMYICCCYWLTDALAVASGSGMATWLRQNQ